MAQAVELLDVYTQVMNDPNTRKYRGQAPSDIPVASVALKVNISDCRLLGGHIRGARVFGSYYREWLLILYR